MGDALVVHLDLPGSVVRDHDEHRRPMAHSRVDLHRVEAERAVTGRDDDHAVGTGEARGDAEWHPDADAAERAGIEHGLCRKRAKLRKSPPSVTTMASGS